MKVDYGNGGILVTKPMCLDTIGQVDALWSKLVGLGIVVVCLGSRFVKEAGLRQSHSPKLCSHSSKDNILEVFRVAFLAFEGRSTEARQCSKDCRSNQQRAMGIPERDTRRTCLRDEEAQGDLAGCSGRGNFGWVRHGWNMEVEEA
jgi:hypothetical protein